MTHSKRDELIGLLDRVHGYQEELLAGLSDEERLAPGTWERWGAKDLLAHIASWNKQLLERLTHLDEPPPEEDVPFEHQNRQTFDRNVTRSYAEVHAEAEQTHAALVAELTRHDDAAIADKERFPRLRGQSISFVGLGNPVAHAVSHLAQFSLERHDAARAHRIQDDITRAILAYDPSPELRGLTLYNLACFYALNGESGRAIELLRESLPLREGLVEWSKQDTDLVSLRELPEYQALYA